jgi:glycosyltransferase involved in cell wall biosynthesis
MMSIAKGLKDRGVLFSLVIVGEGELMNYCKNFIKNHELVNVGLVGLLSHETVSDQYRSADTFLFPARLEEPLGRVVVEAMSAGLPVIASRVGGILELVTDGVEGFLVDKNDISGFIDKLLLLQDKSLLSKMSTAAIKKADSFDQLLVAKRLNDLITGL